MILPETILQDLRYGARLLRRDAGFTFVAILALALGIGVNTAAFTAYKAMVARPLDARDPAEMVNIAQIRDSGAADFTYSYPDYQAYRDSARSFRGLIAFHQERLRLSNTGGIANSSDSDNASWAARWGVMMSGGGSAESTSVFAVSENYFKVLGISVVRGRSFESIPIPELLAAPAMLISENYWRRRFAGDLNVLGKTIRLNEAAVTIIGITPLNFMGTGVAVPDIWLPVSLEPLVHADDTWLRNRENGRYRLFGRLAHGVSGAQAQAELNFLANRLRTLHDPRSDAAKPASVAVWPGSFFPLPLSHYRGLRLTILLIMAAAGMVLIVACANVGSLQLARARSRQHELRTRQSLGASRGRIIRQLLTESAILALLAGSTALLFTWAALKFLTIIVADSLPVGSGALIFDVTPDLETFAYVSGLSILAGVLFELAPALENSRWAQASTARSSTAPIRSRRLQDVSLALQVALSLLLMIAGSMFIHSARQTLKMETGYDAKHVIDVALQFPEASKYTAIRRRALVAEVRAQLAALPGAVAISGGRAPDEYGFFTAVSPDADGSAAHSSQAILSYTYVEANYFQTLDIPMFLGRGFSSGPGQRERAVILSESAARTLWPGQNPVGRAIRLGATDERSHNRSELSAEGPSYQVIGVARDTRGMEFDGSDAQRVYLPLSEDRLPNEPILVSVRSDPAPILKAINSAIAAVDPEITATAATLDKMLRLTPPFISSSLAAAVASAIGLIGLLLASMGIYGTVSYIVVLRTREVGIRMAIGAQKRDILALILGESTRPVLAGLLAGIALAAGVSHLLHGIFYGLQTVDAISFAGVSLLFLAIALVAAYPPSRRALRVDPVVALRYE